MESPIRAEQALHHLDQRFRTQSELTMPRKLFPLLRIWQIIHEERRIAHDGIKSFSRLPMAHISLKQLQALLPGSSIKISGGIYTGPGFYFYRRKMCIGKTLSEHQRQQTRSGAHIKHPARIMQLNPGTKQTGIGADAHRCMILYHVKLPELEIRLSQGSSVLELIASWSIPSNNFTPVVYYLGDEHEPTYSRRTAWMRFTYCTDDHFLQEGKYCF
jgi:hypothetical protein